MYNHQFKNEKNIVNGTTRIIRDSIGDYIFCSVS